MNQGPLRLIVGVIILITAVITTGLCYVDHDLREKIFPTIVPMWIGAAMTLRDFFFGGIHKPEPAVTSQQSTVTTVTESPKPSEPPSDKP